MSKSVNNTNTSTKFSPYTARYLQAYYDVGSMSLSYIEPAIAGDMTYSIQCYNDNSLRPVTVSGVIMDWDMILLMGVGTVSTEIWS
jgi:hypothetical protein